MKRPIWFRVRPDRRGWTLRLAGMGRNWRVCRRADVHDGGLGRIAALLCTAALTSEKAQKF